MSRDVLVQAQFLADLRAHIAFLENENGCLRHAAAVATIGHNQLNRMIAIAEGAGAPRHLHVEDQMRWLAQRVKEARK